MCCIQLQCYSIKISYSLELIERDSPFSGRISDIIWKLKCLGQCDVHCGCCLIVISTQFWSKIRSYLHASSQMIPMYNVKSEGKSLRDSGSKMRLKRFQIPTNRSLDHWCCSVISASEHEHRSMSFLPLSLYCQHLCPCTTISFTTLKPSNQFLSTFGETLNKMDSKMKRVKEGVSAKISIIYHFLQLQAIAISCLPTS